MIRNFAKNLEGWLKGAMRGVPDEMVKTKVIPDGCTYYIVYGFTRRWFRVVSLSPS